MDFDVIVLGTGLSESILTAALSKAGFKVGHFDSNPYYGGDDASLTVDDLREWADFRKQGGDASYLQTQQRRFSSISFSSSDVPRPRQFSISLSPTIIPSNGPLVDALVASSVSRYGGFKLLEGIAVYDQPSKAKPVPTSKEDVFKNKELSLVDKRRLMRFLMFASGEFENTPEISGYESQPFLVFLREKFSLTNKVAEAIVYALAFCTSAADVTLAALQRIRRYLRSAGRYGPSPFLVGHYGGIGEIAQGFCRAAAVSGATYILGRNVASLQPSPPADSSHRWNVHVEDLEEQPTCYVVAADMDYSPTPIDTPSSQPVRRVARCIAIINQPIRISQSSTEPSEETSEKEKLATPGEIDTGLLIFPPSSVEGGSSSSAASCLITGEGSLSAPAGHWVLHIAMPLVEEGASLDPEKALKPYLGAALSLTESPETTPKPPLTIFYVQTVQDADMLVFSDNLQPSIIASDVLYMSEIADAAATHAEEAFWKIAKGLEKKGVKPSKVRRDGEGEDKDEEPEPITQFWPPLDSLGDDSDD